MTNKTLLLVDADRQLHEQIRQYSQTTSYQVLSAFSAKEALDVLDRQHVDLIITDLRLSDMSGNLFIDIICKQWHFLIYTQHISENDLLEAFAKGADDVLTKSHIGIIELFLKINTILRRRFQHIFQIHELRIDTQTEEVWMGSKPIELTGQSYRFLLELATHVNCVCTRDQLMKAMASDTTSPGYRSLYVMAYRVRYLIEPNPSRPQYIHNVPGVGYMLKYQPS